MSIIQLIAGSAIVQVLLTLVLYTLYAMLVGLAMTPSAALVMWGVETLLQQGRWFAFAMVLGGSLFLFFASAILVLGLAIRLLSWGVQPGRYPFKSFTVLRWLIYSGIFTLMNNYVLPVVPMSFLTNAFFRIIGCKMGKNVKLNSHMLNDAYLLTLGDDVIIGGQTDISCHLYENGHLILQPISIGDKTVIGAHCYISPGVRIGKRCVIGLGCYVRKDKVIEDDSRVTSVASVSLSTANKIEKGRF